MNRVQDKVLVITGAAQGIGYGIAEMLAREGGRVVLGDINAEKGEAAAAAIRAAGGQAVFQPCDVVSEVECQALIARATAEFGRLDGLVNNAGFYPRGTIETTTTELWETIMAVNARSAFYCCKYAIPALRAAGGGSIVNIGSSNGLQAWPNLFAYGAAKGALLNMTRTLAGAHAHDRIRVNYLIPGWVLTEGEVDLHTRLGVDEADLRAQGARQPLGRHQTPQDAAYAAVYLLADESSQMTGTIFSVDAGHSSIRAIRFAADE